MSLRFHLVVSDMDPGNDKVLVQEHGCKDVGANKFFCFVDLNI